MPVLVSALELVQAPVLVLSPVLVSASALTQPGILPETERDLMVWRELEAKEKGEAVTREGIFMQGHILETI